MQRYFLGVAVSGSRSIQLLHFDTSDAFILLHLIKWDHLAKSNDPMFPREWFFEIKFIHWNYSSNKKDTHGGLKKQEKK